MMTVNFGTRAVATQFGYAIYQIQQAPPGIERVEAFLGRLRAIDSTRTPPEVQQALHDYIAAIEPSIQAARSGRSIAPYDRAIAQAKQRLVEVVEVPLNRLVPAQRPQVGRDIAKRRDA